MFCETKFGWKSFWIFTKLDSRKKTFALCYLFQEYVIHEPK